MHKSFIHTARFAFLHSSTHVFSGVIHCKSGELVGQPHALNLLGCFYGTSFVEQSSRIGHVFCNFAECIEVKLRGSSGLANHPVSRLGAHIKLDCHGVGNVTLLENREYYIKRTELRWPGVAFVIAFE